ncbi:MAG: hypothetical protein IKB08_08140 [Clostridia bacterium]|nr:hypothetical protein [Clostridia bacterium]
MHCCVFPFDGKCPDFIQLRRFSAETRMQMGEMRAFSGKSRLFPYAQGKTNLTADIAEKNGAEIVLFVVFGGGKPYISTANRRKQSADNLLKG